MWRCMHTGYSTYGRVVSWGVVNVMIRLPPPCPCREDREKRLHHQHLGRLYPALLGRIEYGCIDVWMYVSFACPPACVQMDGYVVTLGFRPRSEPAAKGHVADALSPSLVADWSKVDTVYYILSR